MQKTESAYGNFLFNEIILRGLKKCVDDRGLSLAMKQKVLTLLYASNLESDFTSNNSVDEVFGSDNILGLSSQLLKELPDPLTEHETEELRQCVLEKVKALHKKILVLSNSQKDLNVNENGKDKEVENFHSCLESEIEKQNDEIDRMISVEQQLTNLNINTYKVVKDIADNLKDRPDLLSHNSEYLYKDILMCITKGERRDALKKVEKVFEDKIRNLEMEAELLKL